MDEINCISPRIVARCFLGSVTAQPLQLACHHVCHVVPSWVLQNKTDSPDLDVAGGAKLVRLMYQRSPITLESAFLKRSRRFTAMTECLNFPPREMAAKAHCDITLAGGCRGYGKREISIASGPSEAGEWTIDGHDHRSGFMRCGSSARSLSLHAGFIKQHQPMKLVHSVDTKPTLPGLHSNRAGSRKCATILQLGAGDGTNRLYDHLVTGHTPSLVTTTICSVCCRSSNAVRLLQYTHT